MNAQATKETETTNAQGTVEKMVETIDRRSSPGQVQEVRKAQVIHQSQPKGKSTTTSGGVLAGAAASVASTLESAKNAITGK